MTHITEPAARQVFQSLSELAWATADGQTRPHRDALLQGASFKHSFGRPTHIVRGTIVDYTAIAHCYKVQLSQGLPTVAAFQLTDTSTGPVGPRQINILQVGTSVWVAITERGRYGYILGVDPVWAFDSRLQLLDQLSQTTRARVDSAHRTPLLMFEAGGAVNKIAWRPFDGVGGDAGWINAKGGAISIDDWMARLSASEMCGVFAFQHDNLLRIAGYNYERRTAGGEHVVYNDQDEIHEVDGSTPYPWENLGLFSRTDPRQEFTPMNFQIEQPHYANWEPLYDDQAPFHRRVVFGGYLGQGRLEYQIIPPKSPPQALRMSDLPKTYSVHQDVTTLDGWRGIRASKGLLLIKAPPRPAPLRKKKPEDPTGDTDKNYKAAGQLGDSNAASHRITGDIAATATSLQTAAGILDLNAHLFNWQAEHTFHYHTQDWSLPNDRELPESAITYPQFTELRGSMYIDPPSPRSLKVDDRYGNQKYHPNIAYMGLLPTGPAVLADGEGAEIRLAGGHVFITAPGDIWMKSGRNVNTWAGWDAITRAQNSFDISATISDGRIKAQRHLHMLGGNDKESGSVLIECRSVRDEIDFTSPGQETRATGIIFKAAKADVAAIANNIYLRTGSNDGSVAAGEIVLDADRGRQAVVLHASRVSQFVRGTSEILFGTDGNFKKGISLSQGISRFGMPAAFDGTVIAADGVVAGGNILVANGHIATDKAESAKFFVSPLKDQAKDAVTKAISESRSAVGATLIKTAKEEYNASPNELFYGEKQLGNDKVLKTIQFSFRTEDEYKSTDWEIFEDRWQQLARLSSQELAKWKETPVETVNGGKRYPYPGAMYFDPEKATTAYNTQTLNLFSIVSGVASSRGESYEDPQLAAPRATTLNENYLVLMNP